MDVNLDFYDVAGRSDLWIFSIFKFRFLRSPVYTVQYGITTVVLLYYSATVFTVCSCVHGKTALYILIWY